MLIVKHLVVPGGNESWVIGEIIVGDVTEVHFPAAHWDNEEPTKDMGDANKLCCPVIIFRSNVIPLRAGLITDNCWLYSCFSLSFFFSLPTSLNGFMGYGLSNVVAKCHFLFYWNDSNVCAVVEVRSPFMKFALWLISRSRQVSFSLSLCSCGRTEQTLHKFAWTMLISHKFDPEMMSSKSAYDFSQGSLFLCTAVLRLHRNCKPACVKLIETLEFWTAEGSEQSASLPSLPRPLE